MLSVRGTLHLLQPSETVSSVLEPNPHPEHPRFRVPRGTGQEKEHEAPDSGLRPRRSHGATAIPRGHGPLTPGCRCPARGHPAQPVVHTPKPRASAGSERRGSSPKASHGAGVPCEKLNKTNPLFLPTWSLRRWRNRKTKKVAKLPHDSREGWTRHVPLAPGRGAETGLGRPGVGGEVGDPRRAEAPGARLWGQR